MRVLPRLRPSVYPSPGAVVHLYRPTCTRHADGFKTDPCFAVKIQSSYATDMTSIPESSELMVEHASEAFMEDFRYAEAIARSAVALLARREMHAGPANVV